MKTKITSKSLLVACLVGLAFVMCAASALASSTNWAASSGNWSTCTNWSNGCPDATKDAYINNSGTAAITDPNASAQSLTLGQINLASGKVSVVGSNGTLTIGTPQDNLGPVYIGDAGRGTMGIANAGSVVCSLAVIAHQVGSNGTVTVDGANSLWSLKNRLAISGEYNTTGGTALLSLTNGGTVVADLPSNIPVNVWVGASGTVAGNATLRATGGEDNVIAKVVITGTLAPSGAGGTLTLDSSSVLLSTNSATTCTVTPQDNPSTAQIHVTGHVQLGGHLIVAMTGTTFSPGTTYTLLHADGGLFNSTRFGSSSINYGPNQQCFTPTIAYDDDNVYLYLEPCN